MRIKKIITYPYSGGTPQVKQYTYQDNLRPEYAYLAPQMYCYQQRTFNTRETESLTIPITFYCYTQANWALSNPSGRMLGASRVPMVYETVTEYYGDLNTNQGKTVFTYNEPVQGDDQNEDPHFEGPYPHDHGNYRPTLWRKDEFKNENGQYKLVRRTMYNHQRVNDLTFHTGFNLASDLNFRNMSGPDDDAFGFFNNFLNFELYPTMHFSDCKGYTGLSLLQQSDVFDYMDETHYVKTTTTYQYNSHAQLLSKSIANSKGEMITSQYKYPNDFSSVEPYATMVNRNILAPVIEESVVKDGSTFLQSVKTNYNFWPWGYGVSNRIVPEYVQTKTMDHSVETRVRYHEYDEKNNPLLVSKENDVRHRYVWAYNKTYPIAHIQNVNDDMWAYTSFEDGEKGNWQLFGDGFIPVDATAPMGKRCLDMSGSSLHGSVSSAGRYIVSYWYKLGSSINVTGTVLESATSQPKNGWVHVRKKITGVITISITGTGFIDEVRLYPESAAIVSYAYEPGLGIISQCDANDRVTYYEYDASGRLITIRDDDRNILKRICYNYQGQTENCGVNTTPRWENTGTTRCKPCPGNEIYTTNMVQRQERDDNANSDTYNQVRWIDAGYPGTCTVQPAWQNTNVFRCVTIDNQNTGEQERQQIDANPCSNQPPRWVNIGQNTTACPPPAVYQSQDVSGNYYSQNCAATQIPLPYYVNMPGGNFTSSNSTAEATELARQEAQRQANESGGCTTIYIKLVKVNQRTEGDPGSEKTYADYQFKLFSNAAGTISVAAPSDFVINYDQHEFDTENGVPTSHFYVPYIANAFTGMSQVNFNEVELISCSGTWCYNIEFILKPGRYVIIP